MIENFDTDIKLISQEEIDHIVEYVKINSYSFRSHMENSDLTFMIDNQIESSSLVGNKVMIPSYFDKSDAIKSIFRFTRKYWKKINNFYIDSDEYRPAISLMIDRMHRVDEFCHVIKFLYEWNRSPYQNDDNKVLYDCIQSITDDTKHPESPIGHYALQFVSNASKDFRTLNTGVSMRILYNQLFNEKFLYYGDKLHVKKILTNPLKSFKDTLPLYEAYKVGEEPNAQNYLKNTDKLVQHKANDIAYAIITDQSISNFVWFAEFERSFNEKIADMEEFPEEPVNNILEFKKK